MTEFNLLMIMNQVNEVSRIYYESVRDQMYLDMLAEFGRPKLFFLEDELYMFEEEEYDE